MERAGLWRGVTPMDHGRGGGFLGARTISLRDGAAARLYKPVERGFENGILKNGVALFRKAAGKRGKT